MKRRAFIAGVIGAVAGSVRAAELDNFPRPKPAAAELDNGPASVVVITKPAKYRDPVGHTHTCGAGHTWDHELNPGHTCTAPVVRGGKVVPCGLYQNVWDNPARMVPVSEETPAAKLKLESVGQDFDGTVKPIQSITYPGCQGGNCPSPNAGFRSFRIFRRE